MSYNTVAAMTLGPMDPSVPQESQSTTTATKHSLMSLPMEARLMIYENVVDCKLKHWYRLHSIYTRGAVGTNMLRVCKMMRAELIKYIYRSIVVAQDSTCIDYWTGFFQRANPLDMAYIQEFTFQLDCWGPPSVCIHAEQQNKWTNLSATLAMSDVNPRSLRVIFSPCRDMLQWGEDTTRELDGYAFTSCQIYRDMAFLKLVSSNFGKVPKMELDGFINPVFAYSLQQRFGFIIKRQYRYDDTHGWLRLPRWTLIHPASFNPATDLKGFVKSPTHEGVYDKEGEQMEDNRVTW
ncbi:hypothetical protein GGS26DRAFT_561114 [Hypomontagnella submonticulosa]|nr:hypothetical protein GGS26DRAFT_561114 [Hypomontagnella submonticulosa]